MTQVRSITTVVLLISGCVTTQTPVPKLPFDEAMGWQAAQARLRGAPIEDLHASESLATAMRLFSLSSHATRQQTMRGAPMPAAQLEAWSVVLTEVEHFAAIAPRASSVLDTVRTRLQLESEIETDGSVYGDVPVQLTDRVQLALDALSVKLTAQTTMVRPLAPPKFQWPVAPVLVTSAYGDRLHPIHGEYRFHAGTDLAAEPSQSIYAAESGVVVFSGWNGGHGKQVEVQHDGHLTTRYSHLDALLVHSGQHVKRGDLLGLAGQTGLATGVHLHFEVRRDGQALNPEFVMNSQNAFAGAMR